MCLVCYIYALLAHVFLCTYLADFLILSILCSHLFLNTNMDIYFNLAQVDDLEMLLHL